MATSDLVNEWASDWSDTYAQDWNEERLRSLVGKNVKALGPELTEEEIEDGKKRRGFLKKRIIGFSIDTLPTDEADVHRFSVITDDGLQVALHASMEVEELPEE
jgi:hypothetical protein